MRIDDDWTGGVLILSIRGRLDSSGARELRGRIEEALDEGHCHVLLDICRTRRIDDPGLDTLRRCVHLLRDAGGDLKLTGIPRRLRRLAALSGLLRIFDVHDHLERAIQAFDVRPPVPLPLAA